MSEDVLLFEDEETVEVERVSVDDLVKLHRAKKRAEAKLKKATATFKEQVKDTLVPGKKKVFTGDKGTVTFAKEGSKRVITDIEGLVKALRKKIPKSENEKFYGMLSVAMTDLDGYIAKADQGAFIELKEEARKVSIKEDKK